MTGSRSVVIILLLHLPCSSSAENKTDRFAFLCDSVSNKTLSLSKSISSIYDDPVVCKNITLKTHQDDPMPINERLQLHLVATINDSKLPTIAPMMDSKYEKIYTDSAYLQFFGAASIGIIAMLPEGISKWSEEDKKVASIDSLLKKHSDHINEGPIWDEDEWAVNYIGHPVSGSFYYVWGRQVGLNWGESTVLSALMSTFFWEYGWESFAETASIQDIVSTPLLGAIMGEGANYLYDKVMQNDGMVYDSVILGSVARALLNPIGELNSHFDNLFDTLHIQTSVDYSFNQNIGNYMLTADMEDVPYITQSYFGFKFSLKP